MNNVGTNFRKPTIEYSAEEYSQLMTVNLESSFHLSQLAYPLLKASGKGCIVFLSSVAGVTSMGTGSVYAAAKGYQFLPNLMHFLSCTCDRSNFITNKEKTNIFCSFNFQPQLISLQKIWLVNGQKTT